VKQTGKDLLRCVVHIVTNSIRQSLLSLIGGTKCKLLKVFHCEFEQHM